VLLLGVPLAQLATVLTQHPRASSTRRSVVGTATLLQLAVHARIVAALPLCATASMRWATEQHLGVAQLGSVVMSAAFLVFLETQ
jgi:hypothetical protein